MKKALVYVPLVAVLTLMLVAPAPNAAAADGKELFVGNKCNLCHSIESQGIKKMSEKMKGAELSDVGNQVSDAAWLKGFLKQEELKDGKKHGKKWTGTDEDLDTLVNWVLSLKKS